MPMVCFLDSPCFKIECLGQNPVGKLHHSISELGASYEAITEWLKSKENK